MDVTSASIPTVVGQFGIQAYDLALDANRLYAVGDSGLEIYDLTNPLVPVDIGGLLDFTETHVAARSGLVYAARSSELVVIDATTPAAPVVTSTLTATYEIADLKLSGNRAVAVSGFSYTEGEFGSIMLLGLSDPAHPVRLDTEPMSWFPTAVAFADDGLWVGGENRCSVYPVGGNGSIGLPLGVAFGGYTAAITAQGRDVFIGTGNPWGSCGGNGALSIYATSATNQKFVLGRLSTPELPNAVVTSGSAAYATNLSTGLSIFDLSNPTAPLARGAYSLWAASSVEAYTHYVYVGTYYDGLQVLDVSNLDAPVLVGTVAIPWIFDLKRVGSLLYVTGLDELRILDLSSPVAPALLGQRSVPGINPQVEVVGTRAYFQGEDVLTILDVSQPTNPVRLGSVDVNFGRGIALVGDLAYVPTGAPPGLNVYSVANAAHPVLAEQLAVGTSEEGIIAIGSQVLVNQYGRCELIDASVPGFSMVVGGAFKPGDIRCFADAGSHLVGVGQSSGNEGGELIVIPKPCVTTAIEGSAHADPAFSLRAWPNPSAETIELRYDARVGVSGLITIFDVGGRVVRELEDGALSIGSRAIVWDGRDAGGRLAPSGLYFARVRVGPAVAETRIVRLATITR